MSVDTPVARKLAWHYAGHIVDALVGIALVAYVARRVSVAAYGVYLVSLALSALLVLVMDLGLLGVIVPGYVARRSRDSEAVAGLFSAAMVFAGLAGCLSIVLAIGLAALLPGPFRLEPALVPTARVLVSVAGAVAALTLMASHLEAVHVAWHRFDTLNRAQISATLVRVGLTIGVFALGYGVVALALVQGAAVLVRGLLLFAELRRFEDRPRFRFHRSDRHALTPLWGTAKWSLVDNIGRQLSMNADSLILATLGSMRAVATYGVGAKVPGQLRLLINRGVGVAMPVMAQRHAEADTRQLRDAFVRLCRLTFVAAVPLLILLAFSSGALIDAWVGSAYAGSALVLRWLLVAILLGQSMSAPCYTALYAVGRAETAARIGVVESAANICLSLALVNHFGGAGLAAATAITHVFGTWFWYMPATCRTMDLRPRRLVAYLASDVAIPVLAMIVTMGTVWLAMSVAPRGAAIATTTMSGAIAYSLAAYRRLRPVTSLLAPGQAL